MTVAEVQRRLTEEMDTAAFGLNRDVRRVMSFLRPHTVVGFKKIRTGADGDGGYVLLDDFRAIDTALSLGIDHNVTWDEDMAGRGMTILQYDHTVDAPRPEDPRMKFERKRIVATPQQDCETIEALVERFDAGGARPNLLLKIDIENDEWPVFDAIDPAVLGRFTQIACEMHAFETLPDTAWRERTERVFRKLTEQHAVIHVHANNHGGIANVANVMVPHVLEVTFALRSLYPMFGSDEIFPTALDMPCNPDEPDIFLGSFRF